jgi:hypothetical protein
MKNSNAWCLVLVVGSITGCGPSFDAATPPGFVKLEEESRYEYRATTADGLVLAVRELPHEPKGDIDFWVRAIQNEMRARGGYAQLETKAVTNVEGLAGKQLWFGHDESSHPHLYALTVFVTEGAIYLLEVGGTKEQIERQRHDLDWAVTQFRADG